MSVSKVQFDGNDLINLENDTVTAGVLRTGYTAHDANGDSITGTYAGIIPSGSLSITENGTYDVTSYAGAEVDVSGGSAGYKLYLKHIIQSPDEGVLKINDESEIEMAMYDTTYSSYGTQVLIPDKVQKFKIYGFEHCGTYGSWASSWARYKPHSGSTWTDISLTRAEASATEIILTEDTDLEILEATCLNKGTLITMADGSRKKIEDIVVGDVVKTYNGTGTVYREEHGNRAFNDERDIWNFEGDHQIITTFRHEFYNIEHQKMMYLSEWTIGEHAYAEDGSIVALIEHVHEDIPCRYFSLWCDGGNCYYAGGLLAGNRFTDEIKIDVL